MRLLATLALFACTANPASRQLPPPGDLDLTVSPSIAMPGDTITITVADAVAGETLYVGYASGDPSEDAFCPAGLGGLCLDLVPRVDVLFTTTPADSDPIVNVLTLPNRVPLGTYSLQAATPYGSATAADLSEAVTLTVTDTCDTWYADLDGDGYGDPDAPVTACVQPDFYVADDTDCDDNNADARPNQNSWFDTPRDDGSYDYNCDGTDTQRWTDIATCSATGAIGTLIFCDGDDGWDNRVPDCGGSRDWESNCDGGTTCSVDTSTRVQDCR